jgi:hypothetical protein
MTRTASIALSTKGLKTANGMSRKEFRFLSGSDTFVCDRFQAMFVSPRIANLVENDCTIDEFVLGHPDSKSFEILEHLICGEVILADDNSIKIMLDLIEDLENVELSELVLNEFGRTWIAGSVSSVKSRFCFNHKRRQSSPFSNSKSSESRRWESTEGRRSSCCEMPDRPNNGRRARSDDH